MTAIFFILMITMLILYSVIPLTIHSQLREAGRGALLRMETEGGLTEENKTDIINSMSFKDFNPEDLTITGTESSTNPCYGSNLILDISYKYHYKTFSFPTVLSINTTDSVQIVSVHFSTTNKKAQ